MPLRRRGLLIAAIAAGVSVSDLTTSFGDPDGGLWGGFAALTDAYNVAGSLWIGPNSAKSGVSAQSGRVYVASDTEFLYYGDSGSWVPIGHIGNDVVTVDSIDDLPDPVGGTITLDSSEVYLFTSFVTSTATLDPNGAPLIGWHGSDGGFIHLGGTTAIQSSGNPFFARSIYIHAPGGTVFDLSAPNTAEFLFQDSSISDAASLGNIASLGTIDGFRVPSIKGVNFEQFDDGLTFDGNPEKIFISGSPMRNVTAAAVDILTFASTLSVDIVDMVNNYIKGVQGDTVVVNAQSGSLPTEIFQYRGTTHDSSVTATNILTGDVGVEKVGTKTLGSYPLKDSAVGISIDYAGTPPTTITGSGAGATQITAASTASNAERMSQSSNGVAQYDARFEEKVKVEATASVSGSNTEFEVSIVKNGSVLSRTANPGFTTNSSNPVTVPVAGKVDLKEGDTLSLALENTGGVADLDVVDYSITV